MLWQASLLFSYFSHVDGERKELFLVTRNSPGTQRNTSDFPSY